MIEIKAWETNDGELFRTYTGAMLHERKQEESNLRHSTIFYKEAWIREYFLEKVIKFEGYSIEDVGKPFFGDEFWGWKCDHDDNPIDMCVYITFKGSHVDCCIFCGEPEERK